ncbi:DNA-directed RNA polymerase I subunit RPA49 Ecym_1109 [Eremothecium cymbalariae DBVPG|uniref:DNA-directed RNA polymerase I subunit RPA49 n=1 Tax=Eremothecium cymbalariae (strain CBS 270.75 / DBVPG 7215 / KCTC 17166 / NRRL Y-17582) TaxID=931890 RepID=G8JMK9_ERECY|nr:hypothetical protein Ecym_1109 [Eremothecium cymbalariae DBVPG\
MTVKRHHTEIEITSVRQQPSIAVASFFKGFRAPKDTSFKLYSKPSSDNYVLHGENERLEYKGKSDELLDESCSYVLGLYDHSKKAIELYKTPVIPTKVYSKSKRNLSGPKIKQGEAKASEMRNALGEAFGTKKAKKAIADIERNRIDSDKVVHSAIDIINNVTDSGKHLPSREQLQTSSSTDRPTPLANVDATDVEQIYPLHNIIPKKEWSFLRVGPIIKEADVEQKLQMLPYSKSQYVAKKISTLTQAAHMQKLQLLYYLSLLLGVYANRRTNDKIMLMQKLNSPPDTLIDGILERFAVLRAGQFGRSKDRSFTIDPQREDKLLCYILVIIMHLDNFLVEVSPIAQELGLKPSKLVNLLKTLGAIVKGATVSQAQAFGIPKSAASTYKIAALKVPFKLPEMNKRMKASRR